MAVQPDILINSTNVSGPPFTSTQRSIDGFSDNINIGQNIQNTFGPNVSEGAVWRDESTYPGFMVTSCGGAASGWVYSKNGGVTWQAIPATPPAGAWVILLPNGNFVGFQLTTTTNLRTVISTDGGNTYTTYNTTLGSACQNIKTPQLDQNGNIWLLLTGFNGTFPNQAWPYLVMKSSNGGQSWSVDVSFNNVFTTPFDGQVRVRQTIGTSGATNQPILFVTLGSADNNGNQIGGLAIYSSTGNGTWTQRYLSNSRAQAVDGQHGALTQLPSGGFFLFVATLSAGVWSSPSTLRSSDGTSWIDDSSRYPGTDVYVREVSSDGINIYAQTWTVANGASGHVYQSANEGVSWSTAPAVYPFSTVSTFYPFFKLLPGIASKYKPRAASPVYIASPRLNDNIGNYKASVRIYN